MKFISTLGRIGAVLALCGLQSCGGGGDDEHRGVHRLLTERQAVGLAAFPSAGWSRLGSTLRVADNQGRATAWRAASDQAWLQVTPSGTTGGTSLLQITADPAALPADAVSQATVTITSPDADVANTETVRVVLWKGAEDPSTHVGGANYVQMTADRAAPYLYAHNGVALDVLHAYLGTVLAHIEAGSGVSLGAMTSSSDGTRLYAVSDTTDEVVVFDLVARAVVARWSLPNAAPTDLGIQYIRPNGMGVLVLSDGSALSATDGAAISRTLPITGYRMAASPAGDALYAVDARQHPLTVRRWSVDYLDNVQPPRLVVEPVRERSNGSGDDGGIGLGYGVALNPDGTQLYSGRARLSTADFSLLGQLPASENDNGLQYLAVGNDGRVCANYGTVVDVFGPGDLLQHQVVSSNFLWGAETTADGLVCVFAESPTSDADRPLRFEPFGP